MRSTLDEGAYHLMVEEPEFLRENGLRSMTAARKFLLAVAGIRLAWDTLEQDTRSLASVLTSELGDVLGPTHWRRLLGALQQDMTRSQICQVGRMVAERWRRRDVTSSDMQHRMERLQARRDRSPRSARSFQPRPEEPAEDRSADLIEPPFHLRSWALTQKCRPPNEMHVSSGPKSAHRAPSRVAGSHNDPGKRRQPEWRAPRETRGAPIPVSCCLSGLPSSSSSTPKSLSFLTET